MQAIPTITILLGMLCASGPGVSQGEEDTVAEMLRTVLDRHREHLFSRAPLVDTDGTAERLSALEDGRWADIEYEDQTPSRWRPSAHLETVRDLALAFSLPGHPLHRDDKALEAIGEALDHWLAHRYQSRNWWWNEIGVPLLMRDILVLGEDRLTPRQRTGALEVIGQHKVRGTGANLVWSAALSLHHGALREDENAVAAAATRLWEEVRADAPEGIQADWSFLQHGARLQTFHYGRAFVAHIAEAAWQLRGTPWAIPPEKRDLVTNTLLEGTQWMARGRHTAPGTMDRMVSRKGSLTAADMTGELELWRDVDPGRRAELDDYLGHIADGTAPTGFRHFPMGDFTAHHRADFSFFVKTLSDRTHLTETINNENLKGAPWLGTGDHWLLRDGIPFSNTQPVWVWDRLPGVTTADNLDAPVRTAFSGGVGNGASGLVAVDYRRAGSADGATLRMRKLTACHGDVVLHLMGGVEASGTTRTLTTAMEQRPLEGPVQVAAGASPPRSLPEGRHALEGVRWLWHGGVAYVPLTPSRVTVRAGGFEGAWRDINLNYDKDDTVRAPFLLAALEHGVHEPAGYAILPGAEPDDADRMAAQASWTVLRNDDALQAVAFADGLHMAAFYAAGAVAGPVPLEVSAPCVALWDESDLWLADPTHAGAHQKIVWDARRYEINLPRKGFALHLRPK